LSGIGVVGVFVVLVGKRHQCDWRASDPLLPIIPILTNRGFTGHEHIDEMGLIHIFIEPDSQPGLYCILPLAPILPPLSPPIPINKAAPSPAPWAALALPVEYHGERKTGKVRSLPMGETTVAEYEAVLPFGISGLVPSHMKHSNPLSILLNVLENIWQRQYDVTKQKPQRILAIKRLIYIFS
jgi:hypothetical protein